VYSVALDCLFTIWTDSFFFCALLAGATIMATATNMTSFFIFCPARKMTPTLRDFKCRAASLSQIHH
jgi:hypothetical protein